MTETERRILANQYRILAALNENESDSFMEKAHALENGYEAHYGDPWFTRDEDVFTKEQCGEVVNVLAMYDDLLMSYRNLQDKSGVDEDMVVFRGFDGNNEPRHMAYARFFCEEFDGGNRFETLRQAPGFSYNSHIPSVRRYRAMLAVWTPLRQAKMSGGEHAWLNKEEVQKVLETKWH
jgi:uncharacterized protein YfbU (UPF0304 family)